MINWIKKDFNSVRGAHLFFTDNKMPAWASVVLYVLILPFGLLLYPFAKLGEFLLLRKIEKDLEKLSSTEK